VDFDVTSEEVARNNSRELLAGSILCDASFGESAAGIEMMYEWHPLVDFL